ncbi:hypothetical protein FHT76_004525 [Rhizobium sp. BK176]|nr:hypothetical protein [Rhizobium sp. BK399]MCS3741537.1 hypothetical protein [Rhizobium sp. BK661]MCS4092853.1 hypothetical protein [Rhizobium sp. BK176]
MKLLKLFRVLDIADLCARRGSGQAVEAVQRQTRVQLFAKSAAVRGTGR